MAQLILNNNIRFDGATVKQIINYKKTGRLPTLADRNFASVAEALTLEMEATRNGSDPERRSGGAVAGKPILTLNHQGETYTIVPHEEIDEKLDGILADPSTAIRGRDRLYMKVRAMKLIGIS